MLLAVGCQKPSSQMIGQNLTQGPNSTNIGSTMTLIYLYRNPFAFE